MTCFSIHIRAATLQSLSQSLAVVSAKWFNFGALLGVPPSTLQAIDNQYHSDCDDCLTRMLIWVIENSRITWSSVAQALGQIGYEDLAEQIRQSHGELIVASIVCNNNCDVLHDCVCRYLTSTI